MQLRKSLAMRLVLLAVLFASTCFNGCTKHIGDLTGQVEASIERDTLNVTYNIHVKGDNIDSIAIQMLPEFNGGSVRYEAEDRVKDSLYRSLGDSLDCCSTPLAPSLYPLLRDSQPDKSDVPETTPLACWWMPALYTSMNGIPTLSLSPSQCRDLLARIDSLLETGRLDSLRKLSIPCKWGIADATSYDTVLQADSILYRKGADLKDGDLRITGVLNYGSTVKAPPSAYCLKVYGADSEQSDHSFNPIAFLWRGIIPQTPRTRLFRFEEQGGFLGMAGGIGVSKFSRSRLASANTGIDYMPALTGGLSYYSPSTIYQLSFEMFGMDSSGSTPSLGTISPFGVRHFPFARNSASLSYYGAVEYTAFKAVTETTEIKKSRFGLEIGVGYDTDFDRLTYSYHTSQDGYHEIEFLLGLVAVRQGKGGLKVSFLKGESIQFATIQAYMENRLDFQTIGRRRTRSLLVQTVMWAGMIGVWSLAY